MTTRTPLSQVSLMHMTAVAKMLVRDRGEPVIGDDTLARLKKFAAWAIVPCAATFHLIAVSKRGRVALLDHGREEVRRWDDFVELGGEGEGRGPDCLKWRRVLTDSRPLMQLAKNTAECMPPGLNRLIHAANIKRINRKIARDQAAVTGPGDDPP